MTLLRLGLLSGTLALAGCALFDDQRRQAETERLMEADAAERQARLKAEGKLRPKEFEVVSNKMGWTRADARGLPPPPTTEELEKKVKAASGQ
ncbi:MAG: hypothetical protein RLZZ550_1534 [Verrucomicrobiota bacterium]|jgi:hypothetical protein